MHLHPNKTIRILRDEVVILDYSRVVGWEYDPRRFGHEKTDELLVPPGKAYTPLTDHLITEVVLSVGCISFSQNCLISKLEEKMQRLETFFTTVIQNEYLPYAPTNAFCGLSITR